MFLSKEIQTLPDDPILGLAQAFLNDSREKKVNLGIGLYKDEKGAPYLFPSVNEAEKILAEKALHKEYPPIQGYLPFIKLYKQLAFGSSINNYASFSMQTVGATNALSLGARFLKSNQISSVIYQSNPTWSNHKLIFSAAGFQIKTYTYLDPKTNDLDFSALCKELNQMEKGSTVLLQPSCHNPTGIDPTLDQWQEISEVMKKQKLVPFFDFAYQGLGKSSNKDREAIELFMKEGHQMLVANSCSKNFGLYGERVGMLTLIGGDQKALDAAGSQLKSIARSIYSVPPLAGARIVETILSSDNLKKQWEKELQAVQKRICRSRALLAAAIAEQSSTLNKQIGMFSFLGITKDQVRLLRDTFGIYLTGNGRINIAGLNEDNIDYVADAFLQVLKQ